MKKSLASIERRFLEHFWFSGDYAIWSDGRVSVTGDVVLLKASGGPMTKLPVCFREVGGIFKADGAGLTSLEGFPESIGGDCVCPNNPLVSLGAANLSVGGDLYLQGKDIDDKFWHEFNSPSIRINGKIYCSVRCLDAIDKIAGVANDFGQEKFFVAYRKDLAVLRCCGGMIGLFGAPKVVTDTIRNSIESVMEHGLVDTPFGKYCVLFASVALSRAGFDANAKW
jgi:hypothetical protein